MQKLHHSFRVCEKLLKHMKMLLSHGCMYLISNHNLLFHASCPLNADGSLKEVEIYPGKRYTGKDLMHNIGMMVRAEVALICAQKGVENGLISPSIMPFILLLIIITSFAAPILLKLLYKHDDKKPPELPEQIPSEQ